MREQKGGKVRDQLNVEQMFAHICRDSPTAHERLKVAEGHVLGFIMTTTVEANQRSEQRVQQFKLSQVQETGQVSLPTLIHSFVCG